VLPTHISNDLESFYYVFCWLIASFDTAGMLKAELPKELTWWDGERPFAGAMKAGHIGDDFDLPVSPCFSKAIPELANRLHAFFRFLWNPKYTTLLETTMTFYLASGRA